MWSELAREAFRRINSRDYINTARLLGEIKTRSVFEWYVVSLVAEGHNHGGKRRILDLLECARQDLADAPRELLVVLATAADELTLILEFLLSDDLYQEILAVIEQYRDDPEIAHWEGRVLTSWAHVAFHTRQYALAQERSARGADLIEASSHPYETSHGWCVVYRSRLMAAAAGFLERQSEEARRYLSALPQVPENWGSGYRHLAEGLMALLEGDGAKAVEALDRARRLSDVPSTAQMVRLLQAEALRLAVDRRSLTAPGRMVALSAS